MKKTLILATCSLVASLWTAGAAAADPALGMWKTEVDDGAYAHVKMAPCGSNVCGTIVKTYKQLYPNITPNCLLEPNGIPESWKQPWELASIDQW